MKSIAVLAFFASAGIAFGQQADIVLQDFEGADYGAWTATGTAFGSGPAHGALPGQQKVSGYLGNGLASSFHGGDDAAGTLTSPTFTVERKFINFLIGGGARSPDINMVLLVDGKPVRRATGVDNEHLQWKSWDVSDLAGKTAQIELVDQGKGGWGHMSVDQITQSDTKQGTVVTMEDSGSPAQRDIAITQRYLYVPVKESALPRRMECFVDGQSVHYSEIKLTDDGVSDFPALIDVGPFMGKTMTIKVDRLPQDSLALSGITQDNALHDAMTAYHEKYRPQFHYTARRGWLNDPNGLVFYQGEYHLFHQYNPTGLTGAGFNMHWGHAVSPDLVHWQELPIAIFPNAMEKGIWSGSAVVDWRNTSGLQKGSEPPLVLFYASVGKAVAQFMAFSNDRGRTWTRYAENPVVPNIVRVNRDPKVTWDEKGKRWIMALFLDGHDYALLISSDLKQWTQLQKLTLPDCAECPDFFPMTGGDPNTWVFVAGNGHYLVGMLNVDGFAYQGAPQRVDFGNSCYAVQTWSDIPPGDGRRIQIGWMPGPPYPGMPFSQLMSFPCVLTLHTTADGPRLFKYPVEEIARLHDKAHTWKDTPLAPGQNLLSDINGDLFDISAEIEVGDAAEVGFTVRGYPVRVDVKGQRVICDGPAPLAITNGRVKLRILVDRTSVEVYGNDGQAALTNRFLPKDDNRGLEIYAKGGTAKIDSLEVDELKSAWPDVAPVP